MNGITVYSCTIRVQTNIKSYGDWIYRNPVVPRKCTRMCKKRNKVGPVDDWYGT